MQMGTMSNRINGINEFTMANKEQKNNQCYKHYHHHHHHHYYHHHHRRHHHSSHRNDENIEDNCQRLEFHDDEFSMDSGCSSGDSSTDSSEKVSSRNSDCCNRHSSNHDYVKQINSLHGSHESLQTTFKKKLLRFWNFKNNTSLSSRDVELSLSTYSLSNDHNSNDNNSVKKSLSLKALKSVFHNSKDRNLEKYSPSFWHSMDNNSLSDPDAESSLSSQNLANVHDSVNDNACGNYDSTKKSMSDVLKKVLQNLTTNSSENKDKRYVKKSPKKILRSPMTYTYAKGLSGLPTLRVPARKINQHAISCLCIECRTQFFR